jgi:putative transcriptional regulator
MTDKERRTKIRPMPRTIPLRFALGRLTQEQFAELYRIPLDIIRSWEERRSEPDAIAKAYLKLIAYDAEHVRKALAYKPGDPR